MIPEKVTVEAGNPAHEAIQSVWIGGPLYPIGALKLL